MAAKHTPVPSLICHSSCRQNVSDQVAPRRRTSENSIELSPLRWWRSRAPQNLDRRHVRRIRWALLRTDPVHDCDWMRAVAGDPAAAIGVGIRILKTHGMTNPLIDVVMSAVLCCALEDDHASRVVISSALRRRRKIDPRCNDLILPWLEARFRSRGAPL
jgi:hypothetical protein